MGQTEGKSKMVDLNRNAIVISLGVSRMNSIVEEKIFKLVLKNT